MKRSKLLLGLGVLAIVAAAGFFVGTHSSGVGEMCVTASADFDAVAHLAPNECVSSSETRLTAPTIFSPAPRAWKVIGEFTFWRGVGALTPDCANEVTIPLGRLEAGRYSLGALEFELPLKSERVCAK